MSSNIPVIDQTQSLPILKAAMHINRPLMLWGPPGVGKSQVVAQFARSIGAELVDIRLSQYDSVDLRGLPDVQHGFTTWCPPVTLPFVGSDFPSDKPIVLFLDEIMQATPGVLAVAFQLILDRAVGEHRLLDEVLIVGASNRETDRAGVSRMPTPLANRFIHVEIEASYDAWRLWAEEAGIATEVIAFLGQHPQHLNGFEEAARTGAKAFPTPRAWTTVSDAVLMLAREPEWRDLMVLGSIGEAVGAEFNAFQRIAEQLPSFEDIVARPTRGRIPTKTDALYALTAMLCRRVTMETGKAVVRFIRRLPLEYQTLWLSDLCRVRPELLLKIPDALLLQMELESSMGRAA